MSIELSDQIKFFSNPTKFHRWLGKNHDKQSELWVGFYKKHSDKPSITYPEALDEALCYGWIDGLRKSIDGVSYKIRFTPRQAKSTWSLVNIKRVEELKRLGRMRASGLKAFENRDPKRSGIYSFENAPRNLDAAYEKKFQSNKRAWAFFQAQPPGYRRTASWYVMSAKKEETRWRRLATLISESEKGVRLGLVTGKAKA
jgi:uncharacterized protein YdeI (YjbR/CyaY-like superfamily)